MAVPRNRHSNARKNSKRAHLAKTKKYVANCSHCGKPKLLHRMCMFCKVYKISSEIIEENNSNKNT